MRGAKGDPDPPSGAADPGGRRRPEVGRIVEKQSEPVAKYLRRWRPHRDSKNVTPTSPDPATTHARRHSRGTAKVLGRVVLHNTPRQSSRSDPIRERILKEFLAKNLCPWGVAAPKQLTSHPVNRRPEDEAQAEAPASTGWRLPVTSSIETWRRTAASCS